MPLLFPERARSSPPLLCVSLSCVSLFVSHFNDFFSDVLQHVAGDEASLLTAGHSDEAAVFVLVAHADLR